MTTQIAPKIIASATKTKMGETTKMTKQTPEVFKADAKSSSGKSFSNQSAVSKLPTSQSAVSKSSSSQPVSRSLSSQSVSRSGGISAGSKSSPCQLSVGAPLAGQLDHGKQGTGQSGGGKQSSTPRRSLPGQSSPRKSIFSKAISQSGGVKKLGASHSPNKPLFPGKATGTGSGQFDLPLALRKKRRPNAGMKKGANVTPEKLLSMAATKPTKDGKPAAPKRKLSQSSPNSAGKKIGGVKHKQDYVPPSSKKRKISRSSKDQDSRNDFYCWVCHKEGSVICCELCPRVYHTTCVQLEAPPVGDWFCPECKRATNAECVDSQSKAMSSLTLDQLSKLLMFALKRLKHLGSEPFLKPVNLQQNPGYEEFIFNPMDLSTLEKNIKKRLYGSTDAFLLEAKWILHNCIVFNGSHHKLTNIARTIIKICEYEMKEIETCPDCYLSASIKRDKWFCEVCCDPHKLVWARLQGFPYWPSKVVREKDGNLDVRFFGQHDRAWVPVSSCFAYSHEIPQQNKKRSASLSNSIAEMELHIQNLVRTFGVSCFRYAPLRTHYRDFECLNIDPAIRSRLMLNRMELGLKSLSYPKPDLEVKEEPESVSIVPSPNGDERGLEDENKDERADEDNADVDIGSNETQPVVRFQVYNVSRANGTIKVDSHGKLAGNSTVRRPVEKAPEPGSGTSSPNKAPTGVFEVSEDAKVKSGEVTPSGTATGSFGRSLAVRLSKVSPRSLGKLMKQKYQHDDSETVAELDEDLPPEETQEDFEDPQPSGDDSDVSRSTKTDSRGNATPPVPAEDIPSTSTSLSLQQATPTKDKFHINLGKTIETMKASLGIEELHGVEKEPLESESSDSESESSDSDESGMDVDEPGMDVDEPKDLLPVKPSPSLKTAKGQATRDIKCPSPSSDRPVSKKDSNDDDTRSDRLTDSDIDLVMSCHTEVSDSDEGDLVIDEPGETKEAKTQSSQIVGKKSQTSFRSGEVTKDSVDCLQKAAEMPNQSAEAKRRSSPFDTAPPETLPLRTLPPNTPPLETPPSETSLPKTPPSKAPPLKTPASQIPAVQTSAGETSAAESPPVNVSCFSSPETPTNESQPATDNIESSSSSGTQQPVPLFKPFIPSVDPARSPAAPLSSFPKIIETLKGGVSKTTDQEYPSVIKQDDISMSVQNSATKTPALSQAVSKMEVVGKNTLFKKFIDKVSEALEEVFQDFDPDVMQEKLLEEANRCSTDLRLELHRLKWEREQEKVECKQIMELAVAEMKQCMEAEAKIALDNLRCQLEAEKQEEIKRTKTKQWCAMCGKDAVFFCCWNTSYCDYPCQQSHWPVHRTSCQQRGVGNSMLQVQQVPNKQQQQQLPIPQPVNRTIRQALQQQQQQQQQQQHPILPSQPASNQATAMQTLIQYVQAPRMSAPVPTQTPLMNGHPYTIPGRVVGSGGVRIVRP